LGNLTRQRIVRHDVALLLYMLRRKWGTPAALHKVSVGTPDFVSGDKSVSRVAYDIPLFVTSTVQTTRKFEYDIGYLAANKNFTYGGFYEQGDRLGFIAAEDVPGVDDVSQSDYMVIGGHRYNMHRIISLDNNIGWYLHLKRIVGQKKYAVTNINVWQRITFTEDIDAEL
jgi:hypothetical protein